MNTPFTHTSLKKAPYSDSGSYTITDPQLTKLRLRIGKKSKVWEVESRIKGRKCAAITVKLGKFATSTKHGKATVEIVTIDTARQEARKILDLCERGIDPRKVKADTGPTFREAMAAYRKSKPGLSADTSRKLKACEMGMGSYADKPLTEITVADFIHIYAAKRNGEPVETGHKPTRGGCAAAKDVLAWAVAVYNHAALIYPDYDIRNTASVAKDRCSEEWEPRRPFLNKKQLGPWLVQIEARRAVAPSCEKTALDALRFCLFTGLRISEALHLRWADLAFETATIAKTKNKTSHNVRLSTQARAILQDAKNNCEPDSEFIFDVGGKPIKYQQIFRTIKRLELPYDFGAHATRRTMASACEFLEIPLLTYKRMLNHAFKGGVTGGYVNADFDPEAFERYFQKLGDFFEDLKLEALYPSMSPDQIAVARMMKQVESLTPDQQRLLYDNLKPKMERAISLVA